MTETTDSFTWIGARHRITACIVALVRDKDVEADAGKYLAAEYAFEACHTAMLTLAA